jgi:aminopeptidase N
LAALFRSETYYPQLQTFIKKIYTPQFEILGWKATDGEAPRTGSLRATIISMLGTAGDERILKESYNSFMEYRHDPNESFLDGDMRSVIFECALRHNETIVFDELRRMYKDPNTLPEEQRDCLSVMGRVKDEKRHKDMLEYIFFSKNVRLQDISFPLASLAATSNHGGVATWKFFTTNFDVLRSQMGNTGNIWAACIGLACCGLRTSEDIDSVASFFETHSAGAGEKRLAQSMEVVRTKIARRERDRDNLAEFLNARP